MRRGNESRFNSQLDLQGEARSPESSHELFRLADYERHQVRRSDLKPLHGSGPQYESSDDRQRTS